MNAVHLVKIGLMGVVGRYQSRDFAIYSRDSAVICRTERGLESGIVLCTLDEDDPSFTDIRPLDGQILRPVSADDQMILDRLDKFRDRAFEACNRLIIERSIPSLLVDVEHLFDGQSVYFYFMGEVHPELENLTAELAEKYEQKVRFKKFAETLAGGCGPDCGTRDCSTGGCSTCAAGGGCAAKGLKKH